MHVFEFRFLDLLNTLEDHIFEYSRFFVPLKDDPVTIDTFVFQAGTPLFN